MHIRRVIVFPIGLLIGVLATIGFFKWGHSKKTGEDTMQFYSIRINAAALYVLVANPNFNGFKFSHLTYGSNDDYIPILFPQPTDSRNAPISSKNLWSPEEIKLVKLDVETTDPTLFNLPSKDNPDGLKQIKALSAITHDGYFILEPAADKYKYDSDGLLRLYYKIQAYTSGNSLIPIPAGFERLFRLDPIPPGRPYQ